MYMIKYIIKRVIIGVLIGIGIFLFKSNFTYAATYLNSDNAVIYTQSQKCTESNDNLSCQQGTAYKFGYEYNTRKNTNEYEIDMILNNNQYSQLFQNIIYDYSISDTITIDTTHRSLYILLPYSQSQFSLGAGLGSSNTTFTIQMFPQNSINPTTEEIDRHFVFPMNYNFKPYYCSYLDTSDNLTKPCNIILDIGQGNIWKFIADIPINTTINRLTFYFGTNQLYNGSLKSQIYGNFNIKIPQNEKIGYEHGTSENTLYAIYYVNYNTWRQRSNSNNIGIWYYPQGYTIYQPKFSVPNSQYELAFDNVDYSSNIYKWTFTNYTQQQLDELNLTIDNIEEQLQQQEQPNADDTLNGIFNDFNNVYAQNFTSLFSSLFSYPLSKIQEQTEIDLVNSSKTALSRQLCQKSSHFDIGGGATREQEIQFYRDYSFKLPCMHVDVYPNLKYGRFAFYSTNFLGVNLTGSGADFNFTDIWLTIQHGILVYLLFVNVLNIYKYILDSNKAEVEVLEL